MPPKVKINTAVSSYNQGNKLKNLHAEGSYGYAKGTSAVGPGPSKKEKKAIDAKYASKTPSTADRMKQFNTPRANSAIDYMTTPKGYQSDPLKARGGKQPVKKVKVKAKF